MSAEQEVLGFVTNQIGQVIVILLALIGGFRWLDKRNQQKVDEAMVKLLGENKDGKDGIIGNIVQKYENDNRQTRDSMRNLKERFSLVIKYLAGDVRRIDTAVQKIAEKQGVYYNKSEHEYEKEDRRIQNHEPDQNSNGSYSL